MQWLAVAGNEILYGLARARSALVLDVAADLAACQALGCGALEVLEDRPTGQRWLAGASAPSITNVACYPYVAFAPQGEVSRTHYHAVRACLECVEALRAYVGMPSIPPRSQVTSAATGRTSGSN